MLQMQDVSLKGRVAAVNLVAQGGEFIHLLGPNGAGKSSLLCLIGGLLIPDAGQILLGHKALHQYTAPELAACRGMVMQIQQSAFALTVEECLRFFAPKVSLPQALEQALEIRAFYARPLNQLSGGEQRRVMIARCLMQIWPKIEQGQALILMDEPVQGLDYYHQHRLYQVLGGLATQGNLVIVSHHDLNLALHYASRAWLMKDSMMVADGPRQQVLTAAQVSEVFTCGVRMFKQADGNGLIQTYLD